MTEADVKDGHVAYQEVGLNAVSKQLIVSIAANQISLHISEHDIYPDVKRKHMTAGVTSHKCCRLNSSACVSITLDNHAMQTNTRKNKQTNL